MERVINTIVLTFTYLLLQHIQTINVFVEGNNPPLTGLSVMLNGIAQRYQTMKFRF